ncbi:HD domain-containing protein [Candidatus Poribacteria bacterium]|nr:HD domain-containing protein [Candidatus Poribacteria bacterium]
MIQISDFPIWFEDLLTIPEISRLSGIRFHGTLTIHSVNNKVSSRLDHSIDVAKLAYYIGNKIGFPKEQQSALILLSMLHDVGHLPFSHILEPFYRYNLRFYHEGITSLIIRSLIKKNEIQKIVGITPTNIALSVLNGDKRFPLMEEFLFGLFSVDMIDGIHRAALPIGDASLEYNPWELCESFLILGNDLYIKESSLSLIIHFRNVRKCLYKKYIESPEAKALAAMLTRAVELSFPYGVKVNELPKMKDSDLQNLMLADPNARQICAWISQKKLYSFYGDKNDAEEEERQNIGKQFEFNPTLAALVFEFTHIFSENNQTEFQLSLFPIDNNKVIHISELRQTLNFKRQLLLNPKWYFPGKQLLNTECFEFDINHLMNKNNFLWW